MVKTENLDALKIEDLDDAPTISPWPSQPASTKPLATSSLDPEQQQQQQQQSQESECHYQIRAVLDSALAEVMARLWAAPDSYVVRPDEFSLFNFFQGRFDNTDPVIMGARRRYWQFTPA
ncbi:hypothetical protein B0T24DRAFT_685327 [Lasiosphaeria ovina]|uniref:Uncharacterized protein n=1 Tax=Lasiosphaeria ovina TaxID=92902 RepID=A0AAE0MXP4_9PEZI|nr:hypothetical protein B0T24DRAFT_685327 [Lasiosphaeria ovina]